MTDIIFSSQNTNLAGTLWLPSGRPRAGLVMLAGSGPMDRDNAGYFPPIREHLVGQGIAVLSYDKPGIGGSSGDWALESFQDQALAALAAVNWLHQHPALAARSVGLWGHSQGGWIAPLAASQSDQVDFVVCNSGPGVTMAEQIRVDFDAQLNASELTADQKRQAAAFARYMTEQALDPADNYAALQAEIQARQGEAWYSLFADLDRVSWEFTKRNVVYDPRLFLEKVTCPLLALFGEKDVLVPVKESVQIFEQTALKAGNRDQTIVVFPGASHRMLTGSPPVFAPGYLQTMGDWILSRANV